MSGLSVLDIAIGLSFTYLLFSLICSVLNEWIAAGLGSRAKHLWVAIQTLITNPDQLQDFKSHPLIAAMFQNGKKLLNDKKVDPSYISARTFALAVLDLVAGATPAAPAVATTLDTIRTAAKAAVDAGAPQTASKQAKEKAQLAGVVLTFIDKGSTDLAELRQNIENWFNDAMDRLSGWYKRRTQVVLIIISAVVTLAMNVDSIAIATALYASPAVRASVVQEAEAYVQSHPKDDPATMPTTFPSESLKSVNSEVAKLPLPVGWGGVQAPAGCSELFWWVVSKLFGWLLTTAALSLGAPFWFDTLNRFIQFRSSVKPLDKPKP